MNDATMRTRWNLAYMYGMLTESLRGDPFEPDGVSAQTTTMTTDELSKRVSELLIEERNHANQ